MTAHRHWSPTRRAALFGVAGLGLSTTFLARSADAAVGRRKLVVLILRGAMDGLSAVPPVGDANYAALRGPIAIGGFGQPDGALKLDVAFGLHPALSFSHRLAGKGQLRVAPAVATPDRARSHFDAQDVLESGAARVYAGEVGWLNRALSAMGGVAPPAVSVGAQAPLILRGPVQTASWSPGRGADATSRVPTILQDLYKSDPLLGPALATGLQTEAMAQLAMTGLGGPVDAAGEGAATQSGASQPGMTGATEEGRVGRYPGRQAAQQLGSTLGRLMMQDGGPQVAAVSLDGFDTHANQGAATGQLAVRLAYVDALVEGLHGGLGAGWADTVVVAATEFGRTARVNGTRGTDHGTGSAALLLGGALKPGGIVGDWPTLAQGRLYEDRDLLPTMDVRALFKGVLRDHLGVDRAKLDGVFPDSAGAAPVANLV